MATAANARDRDRFGALVGWTHAEFDDKLDLQLQTAETTAGLHRGEFDKVHVVMTRQQALLLANYLLKASGHDGPAAAARRGGRLTRWFGG